MRIFLVASILMLAGCAGLGTNETIAPDAQADSTPDDGNETVSQPDAAPPPSAGGSQDPPATVIPAPVAATNATEPEWGAPSGKGIRPGINMVHDGAGCTTSFVMHYEWTTYYLATAAHCVADGGSSDTNGCTAGTNDLGTDAELRKDTGGTTTGKVVYVSWNTMQRDQETDGGACAGNDFALLEISPDDLDDLHPASLHFQAPTGLATAPTSSIWGYGASSLKFGIEPAHPKEGRHLGTSNGGWSHLVYLASPGIPGDSGGHIMTSDGQALGIASTVLLLPYPAANHYTDIAKSLEYMQAHEGWAPELVTWDDFNASLI